MREPDIVGTEALCWESAAPDIVDPDHTAIASYVICAPHAHPFWAWHTVNVVHLRETERFDAPRLAFPGASHEVMVFALNPEKDAGIDPDDPGTWDMMTPPDVVHQVILPNDEAAVMLAFLVAHSCARGDLIPDSDWRTAWGATLDKTAEHLRLGGHPG